VVVVGVVGGIQNNGWALTTVRLVPIELLRTSSRCAKRLLSRVVSMPTPRAMRALQKSQRRIERSCTAVMTPTVDGRWSLEGSFGWAVFKRLLTGFCCV
jgi:ABC-type antimicrobial peptide transport system ATPase subunit